MDLLTGRRPSSVEVAGEGVPIRTGWRRAARSFSASDEDMRSLIVSWFRIDGMIPEPVLDNPAEALRAALRWRDEPLEGALPYGRGRGGRGGRIVDFEADGAIIASDFMRLYGIDLASWQAHWWDFCTLFAPLAAVEGSLVGRAIAARSPLPANSGKEQRKAHRREAEVWALPLPDDELARMELDRIRREW